MALLISGRNNSAVAPSKESRNGYYESKMMGVYHIEATRLA